MPDLIWFDLHYILQVRVITDKFPNYFCLSNRISMRSSQTFQFELLNSCVLGAIKVYLCASFILVILLVRSCLWASWHGTTRPLCFENLKRTVEDHSVLLIFRFKNWDLKGLMMATPSPSGDVKANIIMFKL
jgi:hypothetical protein